MSYWSGTLYTSATLTGNGNSGWTVWPMMSGGADPTRSDGLYRSGPLKAFLRCEPANLATDETLDLDLDLAFNSDGDGDVKYHDFTQVTSTNVAENLILPGEDSEGLLYIELGTNAGILSAPLPAYWKLTWTLGGTTKSMNFVMYACLWG